jgi:hypothetical protein
MYLSLLQLTGNSQKKVMTACSIRKAENPLFELTLKFRFI